MPRSHPPTLLTICERALREEIRIERGQRVLVAVSGGADSMALLSVLARLAGRNGFTVAAHGCDHGLRSEAPAELDVAETFSARLGIPFTRSMLRLAPGSNLQARARTARYEALRSRAAELGAEWIATAHHADDRAETVLMRLLRGTSPAGLAVLPAQSANLIRPLIRARKADVLAHVARHGIPFVEDPSNQDVRFLRVRVRRELMPLLESLSPRIVDHLTCLADDELDAARHDDDGNALASAGEVTLPLLGFAQRAAVRRMVASASRSARVRLRGGSELRLDRTGTLVMETPHGTDRRSGDPARGAHERDARAAAAPSRPGDCTDESHAHTGSAASGGSMQKRPPDRPEGGAGESNISVPKKDGEA